MHNKTISILAAAGFIAAASYATAADSGMSGSTGWPGDNGRPNQGIEPLVDPTTSDPEPPIAKAPDIDYAVKVARAVADVCKQFKLGVGVVNAKGEPVLIYIPNGSDASHTFWAMRKAVTAITYKTDSSALVKRGQQDKAFAAQIRANPHLIAFSGAVLVKNGNETIGAIAVSGAEPGHHDEECALKGIAKVKQDQK